MGAMLASQNIKWYIVGFMQIMLTAQNALSFLIRLCSLGRVVIGALEAVLKALLQQPMTLLKRLKRAFYKQNLTNFIAAELFLKMLITQKVVT